MLFSKTNGRTEPSQTNSNSAGQLSSLHDYLVALAQRIECILGGLVEVWGSHDIGWPGSALLNVRVSRPLVFLLLWGILLHPGLTVPRCPSRGIPFCGARTTQREPMPTVSLDSLLVRAHHLVGPARCYACSSCPPFSTAAPFLRHTPGSGGHCAYIYGATER